MFTNYLHLHNIYLVIIPIKIKVINFMKKLFKKGHTITFYLIIPLSALIIIEAIIFMLFINLGGTRSYIKDNAYSDFDNSLFLQSFTLNNNMKDNWGNIINNVGNIDTKINNAYNHDKEAINNFLNNPHDNPELISSISVNILKTIHKNNVSGSFIIFDNTYSDTNTENDENSEFMAIYYRDLDLNDNIIDNSDVIFSYGPKYIGENQRLSFDDKWQENINFNNLESTDFFYKPISAARDAIINNKQVDLSDLGYWSKPFKMNDKEVVTYCLPLINDTTNRVYGVYGIEIPLDSIKALLPYQYLGGNENGSFIVATSDNNHNSFKPYFVSGNNFSDLINEGKNIILKADKNNSDVTIIDNNDDKNKIICSVSNLELYPHNSYFSNEQWYLMAVMKENDLFYFSYILSRSLYAALILSFILNVFGIIFISVSFSVPIKRFVHRVKNSDITKPVKLDKTLISELDELSNSIEGLSLNILDNSAKLSQILALSNLSIGAFEFDPNSNSVFCTDVMIKFLSLNKNDFDSNYISKELFLKKLSIIISDLTPKINRVYELKANNRVSWVKVKTMDNNGKILGIVMDVTNETAEKRRIEHERDHDSLTHLFNRFAFLSLLEERINREQNNTVGALIMCDLDNLKRTNDTYGHAFGDRYIRAAADALSFFNQYNGIVARMSGDEFYAYIDGFSSKEECRKVISKFTALFKTAYIHIDRETVIPLKASFGIAWYPDDSDNPTSLLKYADFAMYEVKNNSKNDYKEFDINNYKNSAELIRAKNDLIKLINENLFRYAFQPIVSAKTGEIYAYESLMRPSLPSLKSPLEVLELATLQNRLRDIEKLTWLNSLDFYAKNKEKFGDAKIFINSIPNQVLDSSELDYIDTVYGKYFPNVVLEVIESEKGNDDIIKNKRQRIQSMGGLIALDDFGSGYSNSLALLTITPDLIKMDMDLIRNIDVDIDKQALVQNTIAYANERNIKIVAEGIETEDELKTVIRLGVDLLQGYFLCKPDFDVSTIPEDKVETILRLNKELEEGF